MLNIKNNFFNIGSRKQNSGAYFHRLHTKEIVSMTPRGYAGFWIRSAALLIDLAILWVVRWPLSLLFWAQSDDFSIWGGLKSGSNNTALISLYIAINLLIWFSYFVIMDVRYQATLGKLIMKLKVVGIDLQPISYGKAILRETIGKAISLFVFLTGFVWAAIDPRKQTWHDKIAETYVIKSSTDT
ncbi:MAG: RDD family protein [Actinobacteria bacterium]|nr:RDD family protein [Actinomycetota bacterium]